MNNDEIAEQLYQINRQLSIKIAMNEGLSPEEVCNLNLHIGECIKGLRGQK